MAHSANHPVKTSEKTLMLIEELRHRDGARISELTEEADMTKGAIHNHLSTLREHGFVRKEGDEYYLSLAFMTLGGYVRSKSDLFNYGRPKADQLANDTGMLVNLMTEENGKGIYLYQARGEYAVNLDTYVGHQNHLHDIALGKAILASLPRERVEEIVDRWGLPRATKNTITDPDRLYDALDTVEEQGYATEYEERTEGLACVAAPIQVDGELLGAISISTPTHRLEQQGFKDDVIGEVLSTASEISLDVKYK